MLWLDVLGREGAGDPLSVPLPIGGVVERWAGRLAVDVDEPLLPSGSLLLVLVTAFVVPE